MGTTNDMGKQRTKFTPYRTEVVESPSENPSVVRRRFDKPIAIKPDEELVVDYVKQQAWTEKTNE